MQCASCTQKNKKTFLVLRSLSPSATASKGLWGKESLFHPCTSKGTNWGRLAMYTRHYCITYSEMVLTEYLSTPKHDLNPTSHRVHLIGRLQYMYNSPDNVVTLRDVAANPTLPLLLTAATWMEYRMEGVSPSMVTIPPAFPVPATITLSVPLVEGGE